MALTAANSFAVKASSGTAFMIVAFVAAAQVNVEPL
jgi:hypothetical protein